MELYFQTSYIIAPTKKFWIVVYIKADGFFS
jgi:hypothetical protein